MCFIGYENPILLKLQHKGGLKVRLCAVILLELGFKPNASDL